jgi:hypothetical protein
MIKRLLFWFMGIKRGEKPRGRLQLNRVMAEHGIVVPVDMPVRNGCMVFEEGHCGWLLDPGNQFHDVQTGRWEQLSSERSCLPIMLINKDPEREASLKELVNQIWKQSSRAHIISILREAAVRKLMARLTLLAGIPVGLAVVIILVKFLKGGF